MKKRFLCMVMACLMVFTLAAVPAWGANILTKLPWETMYDEVQNLDRFIAEKYIAFAELTGDDMEELIWVERRSSRDWETGETVTDTYVCVRTYDQGNMTDILNVKVDFGPYDYAGTGLHIWAADGELVICTAYQSEDIAQEEYVRYVFNGKKMSQKETLIYYSDPFHVSGIEGGDEHGQYYYYGLGAKVGGPGEVSEDEYKSAKSYMTKQANPVISMRAFEVITDNPAGMTKDAAMNYCKAMNQKMFPQYLDVSILDWFFGDVDYVTEKGLMNGTGDQRFSPNLPVTRAQIVTILYRLAGSPPASGSSFKDVKPTDWFGPAVEWASKNGIVSGYGNGFFGPNDPLNREQLATILYRYTKFILFKTPANGDLTGFGDWSEVSGYALDPMKWAVGAGLISGTDNGKLMPGGSATRAQMAAILHRYDGIEFEEAPPEADWRSLYQAKVKQIEGEYNNGTRTPASNPAYGDARPFFALQDLDFDGVPELYHTQLLPMMGGECGTEQDYEEIYYIKDGKVRQGTISSSHHLGLIPGYRQGGTGDFTYERWQFVVRDNKSEKRFLTNDSCSYGAQDYPERTIQALAFNSGTGKLTATVVLHQDANSYETPRALTGYTYIADGSTLSWMRWKPEGNLWSWKAL